MTQIDKTGHMSDYLDSSSFFFSTFTSLSALKIVTWRNAGDMVPIIQKEVPKRFALRIRLIETLDGWQDRYHV